MVRQSNWFASGRTSACHHSAAATLLELLLAVSIMVTLATMAYPGWLHLQRWQQQQLQLSQLSHIIRFAQLNALARGRVVTLCGSHHGKRCDGAWQQGLLVELAVNHQLIHYWPRRNRRWRLSWRASFGRNDYLKFAPSGFTLGQQGRFYLCSPQGETSRAVVISRSGRQRLDQSARVKEFCRSTKAV